MLFIPTPIRGAQVIDPAPRHDDRGRFMRVWCANEFADHNITFSAAQANMGLSLRKGTIRGIHFQDAPALEAKLVRCTRGAIFDIVVDLRPDSSSYGKWYGVELNADNGRMLYVPERCGHGCQSLKENTEIFYMTSEFYMPSAVRGVRFDDPTLNIQWPLVPSVISEQDRSWPLLEPTSLP
jgi:dTDP-4-dehydrorhamnose 3,5-epimerase